MDNPVPLSQPERDAGLDWTKGERRWLNYDISSAAYYAERVEREVGSGTMVDVECRAKIEKALEHLKSARALLVERHEKEIAA